MNESAASNFINSLVRNLQVLCHSNVEFRNDIEVVGHLYLKVDKAKKFNYIVDEKVCKNDASSTMFVSNSYHSVNLAPKKKDAASSEGNSNKSSSESSETTGSGIDRSKNNSKPDRPLLSPQHHNIGPGESYKTPVKRTMRSPDPHGSGRKFPRMSSDMSSGGSPQVSFNYSSQQDQNSPLKVDRSMSQDSSSSQSFKDSGGGASETVEIDLTNVKEEVDDDKSAIQASCFFNQEQLDMANQSSIPSFPNLSKDPSSEENIGLYPVSLHPNDGSSMDNMSQLSACSSSQGSSFGQSAQQMPQFLSDIRVVMGNSRAYKELSLEQKVMLIEDFEKSSKPSTLLLSKQYGIGRKTVYNILNRRHYYKSLLQDKPKSPTYDDEEQSSQFDDEALPV